MRRGGGSPGALHEVGLRDDFRILAPKGHRPPAFLVVLFPSMTPSSAHTIYSQQCEDLEDSASLAHLYRIIRTAIMLNDASILEELLKEVSMGARLKSGEPMLFAGGG